MTSSSPAVVHRARRNAFQAEAEWRLGPDALLREGGEPVAAPVWARGARLLAGLIVPWALDRVEPGGAARFSYAGVRELRLSFDPTRFDTARHRCDLRLADGRDVTIFSTHFAGFAEFENRAATYTPLVQGLIGRVAAGNPACRFRAGKGAVRYWAEHIMLFVLFALLVIVLSLFAGGGLSESSYVKLGIIVAYIPVMLAYTRKNWPRRFDPAHIPPELLPRP